MAALIVVAVVTVLSGLAMFASRLGVDSRDDFSEAYRVVGPIGLH